MQSALLKILILIRIKIIRIMQIDEIDKIDVVSINTRVLVDSRDGADCVKLASSAKTTESLLLLFLVAREIKRAISIMFHTTASNAIAIELANDSVFSNRLTEVTV